MIVSQRIKRAKTRNLPPTSQPSSRPRALKSILGESPKSGLSPSILFIVLGLLEVYVVGGGFWFY